MCRDGPKQPLLSRLRARESTASVFRLWAVLAPSLLFAHSGYTGKKDLTTVEDEALRDCLGRKEWPWRARRQSPPSHRSPPGSSGGRSGGGPAPGTSGAAMFLPQRRRAPTRQHSGSWRASPTAGGRRAGLRRPRLLLLGFASAPQAGAARPADNAGSGDGGVDAAQGQTSMLGRRETYDGERKAHGGAVD